MVGSGFCSTPHLVINWELPCLEIPPCLVEKSAGSGGDRRDWERSAIAFSSILAGVKLLTYRDWEGALLVRQPQDTQFSLAVKRLNCTFAFFCLSLLPPSCLVFSGGVWCPEMKCRALSLNQIELIATIWQRFMLGLECLTGRWPYFVLHRYSSVPISLSIYFFLLHTCIH